MAYENLPPPQPFCVAWLIKNLGTKKLLVNVSNLDLNHVVFSGVYMMVGFTFVAHDFLHGKFIFENGLT